MGSAPRHGRDTICTNKLGLETGSLRSGARYLTLGGPFAEARGGPANPVLVGTTTDLPRIAGGPPRWGSFGEHVFMLGHLQDDELLATEGPDAASGAAAAHVESDRVFALGGQLGQVTHQQGEGDFPQVAVCLLGDLGAQPEHHLG